MAKVLKSFRDKEDNKFGYYVNKKQEYPREGYEPSADRVAFLKEEGYIETDVNNETDLNNRTAKELKALLDEKGIEYASGDNKQALIAKLEGAEENEPS